MTRIPRHLLAATLFSLATTQAAASPDPAATRWTAAVVERIQPLWTGFAGNLPRLPPGPLRDDKTIRAEYVLAVEPDGTVATAEPTQVSGQPGFDDAPIEMLVDLGRLPSPPPSLRSDDGRVYLRWRFAPVVDGCREAEVIRRNLRPEQAVPYLVHEGRSDEALARLRATATAEPEEVPQLLSIYGRALATEEADSGDARRRAAAAAALGPMRGGEATLLRLVRDESPQVRRAALTALGRQRRSDAAIALLVELLDGEESGEALASLKALRDPRAIAPLRVALAMGHAPGESADALAALGDTDAATQIVQQRLRTASAADLDTAHLIAAQAALHLPDPALCPELLRAYATVPASLRARIVEALAALRARLPAEGVAVVESAMLDESPAVRAAAATALGTLADRSPRARELLIAALAEPVPGVRIAALTSLVRLHGTDPATELGEVARDRSPWARTALARVLVSRHDQTALDLLTALQADPEVEVRVAVTIALRDARAEEFRPLLARAALDPSPEVRIAALPEDAAAPAEILRERVLRARTPIAALEAVADLLENERDLDQDRGSSALAAGDGTTGTSAWRSTRR